MEPKQQKHPVVDVTGDISKVLCLKEQYCIGTWNVRSIQFSSVQSLCCVWLFATPWTAAHQASLSITNSRSYPNLCPLSQWCHLTISSSVVPFSSCPLSFPASVSFQMSQIFRSGGQNIGFSFNIISSVQFSLSVVSDSLRPHESQHAKPPCPSPTPAVYPNNSCPLRRWCHLTISSSVVPFSSCLQSFPASGSFQMS